MWLKYKTNITQHLYHPPSHSLFHYHSDESIPQLLKCPIASQRFFVPPFLSILAQLYILAFLISQSFPQHVFRHSYFERSGAFDGK
jgi:hypothetical protein